MSNIESDNSQNVGLEDYNNISDEIFSIFYYPLYKDNLRVEGIGKFFQMSWQPWFQVAIELD